MTTETPKNESYTEYYDNGQIFKEGNYKDDVLDGKWTEWYENGQKKSEQNFKNYWPDGKWTEWYENGQIKLEGNYNSNKRDGKWTEWYENAQKSIQGNYKNGLKDGKWSYWNEKSKKTDIKKYKMAVLISWIAWDKNGNVMNLEDEMNAENKVRLQRQNSNYHYDSDLSWIDQQSLTDDEKLLGEDFWRGIL